MDIKVIKTETVMETPEIEVFESSEDKHINEITLQIMMNREMYESYILSQHEQCVVDLKGEQKFYRSRIFQLAKVLLLNEKEREKYYKLNPSFQISRISLDVIACFDQFIQTAIQNFKLIDTNDILQEGCPTEEPPTNVSEVDEYIHPLTHPKQKTLDDFVIKTSEEVEIVYPEQKNININDLKYKKKGLRKKLVLN